MSVLTEENREFIPLSQCGWRILPANKYGLDPPVNMTFRNEMLKIINHRSGLPDTSTTLYNILCEVLGSHITGVTIYNMPPGLRTAGFPIDTLPDHYRVVIHGDSLINGWTFLFIAPYIVHNCDKIVQGGSLLYTEEYVDRGYQEVEPNTMIDLTNDLDSLRVQGKITGPHRWEPLI